MMARLSAPLLAAVLGLLFAVVSVAPAEARVRYAHRGPPAEASLKQYEVHIDPAFSAHERAEIRRAIDEWNRTLNGYVLIVAMDDAIVDAATVGHGGPDVWAVRKSDHFNPILAHDADALATLAFTYRFHGHFVYVVEDNLGRRDLFAVMLHEFGHVLGVSHVGGGALMYPKYEPRIQQCVDETTARAVAYRQSIPAEGLVWCADALRQQRR